MPTMRAASAQSLPPLPCILGALLAAQVCKCVACRAQQLTLSGLTWRKSCGELSLRMPKSPRAHAGHANTQAYAHPADPATSLAAVSAQPVGTA